jgi:gliding motility-associated-like protein
MQRLLVAPEGTYDNLNITVSGCTSVEDVDITLTDPALPIITDIETSMGIFDAPDATYLHLICSGDTGIVYAALPDGAYDYQWEAQGGEILRTQENNVVVNWGSNNGDRKIYVKAVSLLECESERFEAKVFIDEPQLDLGSDKTICRGDNLPLRPEGDFIFYNWHDGSTGSSYNLNKSELVSLTVIDEYGCRESDTILAELFELPVVDLGPDTSLCGNEYLILDGGSDGNIYNWSTGATTRTITVFEGEQTIILQLQNEYGCISSDSLKINSCSVEERFKNITNGFTPNGDGMNDVWQIPELDAFPDAVVVVYDRWGKIVFHSGHGYNNPWDGNSDSGNELPMDNYFYVIDFHKDGLKSLVGTVTIIK